MAGVPWNLSARTILRVSSNMAILLGNHHNLMIIYPFGQVESGHLWLIYQKRWFFSSSQTVSLPGNHQFWALKMDDYPQMVIFQTVNQRVSIKFWALFTWNFGVPPWLWTPTPRNGSRAMALRCPSLRTVQRGWSEVTRLTRLRGRREQLPALEGGKWWLNGRNGKKWGLNFGYKIALI
jgi:hypothetical protein